MNRTVRLLVAVSTLFLIGGCEFDEFLEVAEFTYVDSNGGLYFDFDGWKAEEDDNDEEWYDDWSWACWPFDC
jgi:hypothetical protein